MADVFQKIVSGNDYHQGYVVTTANKFGSYDSVAPQFNQIDGIAAQSGLLDTRFDDVRYYTGDAST